MNNPRMIYFKDVWLNFNKISLIFIYKTVYDNEFAIGLSFKCEKDVSYDFRYLYQNGKKINHLDAYNEAINNARVDLFILLKLVYDCEIIKHNEDIYTFKFPDNIEAPKIDV